MTFDKYVLKYIVEVYSNIGHFLQPIWKNTDIYLSFINRVTDEN